MADWAKIKTEYITTKASYRQLAEKYGVHYQSICRKSQEEHWIEQREQHVNKTVTKALNKISNNQVDKIARIDALTDKLLAKLEQAVDELDLKITSRKIKTEEYDMEVTLETLEASPGGIVDRKGLRELTSALKDIKEIKMVRHELDEAEQQARIAKLRREAEADEADKNRKITIEIAGGDASWAE